MSCEWQHNAQRRRYNSYTHTRLSLSRFLRPILSLFLFFLYASHSQVFETEFVIREPSLLQEKEEEKRRIWDIL